jgi:hypothetical protein
VRAKEKIINTSLRVLEVIIYDTGFWLLQLQHSDFPRLIATTHARDSLEFSSSSIKIVLYFSFLLSYTFFLYCEEAKALNTLTRPLRRAENVKFSEFLVSVAVVKPLDICLQAFDSLRLRGCWCREVFHFVLVLELAPKNLQAYQKAMQKSAIAEQESVLGQHKKRD